MVISSHSYLQGLTVSYTSLPFHSRNPLSFSLSLSLSLHMGQYHSFVGRHVACSANPDKLVKIIAKIKIISFRSYSMQ